MTKKRYPTLEEYFEERGLDKDDSNFRRDVKFELPWKEGTHETTPASDKVTGKRLDSDYKNDMSEYDKMLDFLRGKKNVSDGNLGDKPVPPKDVPKGWFVVDEVSKGFWAAGGWTQDPDMLLGSMLKTESAANELSRVVGGLVIPAEEVMG